MAIDIPGSCHLLPRDEGMPRLQIIRQTARSFGDDLKAACDGIDGARVALKFRLIEPLDEVVREFDVMQDITKGGVGTA